MLRKVNTYTVRNQHRTSKDMVQFHNAILETTVSRSASPLVSIKTGGLSSHSRAFAQNRWGSKRLIHGSYKTKTNCLGNI